VHDFYKRKKYLSTINQTGASKLKQMEEAYAEESAIYYAEQHRIAEQKFKDQTARLHYLISTSSIRGVLNPKRERLSGVYIKDQPLEDHIKTNGRTIAKRGDEKYYSFEKEREKKLMMQKEKDREAFTLPPIRSPSPLQVSVSVIPTNYNRTLCHR
jgi:hypothetical protein